MTYSRDERSALCALLDDTGPDAPTLCEGWTTLDLAAHLVLREHRPDAGMGMLGGPLAGYTAHVQSRIAGRVPYARLVQTIRQGPPRFSLFALPGVDERANLAEYFVHHEDVRRAAPDWQPRKLPPELTEQLWQRLRLRATGSYCARCRSGSRSPATTWTPATAPTAAVRGSCASRSGTGLRS